MKITEAMEELFGPVPKSYSKAIAARWKASQDEHLEERKMSDSVKRAEAKLRDHISDRLLTRKVRRLHPHWWISWDSTKLHYVNYDTSGGKSELMGPSVEFSLHLECPVSIKVSTSFHDGLANALLHLDAVLLRVAKMADQGAL